MRGPDSDRRRRLTAVPVGAALLLLAACGGGAGEQGAGDQVVVVAPSQAPLPLASGPRVGASGSTNVLTGEPVLGGRVLAAVLDDTATGPPVGLEQADVVYVRADDTGATRLLALFQTRVPARVGPLGPARAGDAEVLGRHGAVALAVTEADAATDLASTDLQLVSLADGPEGFARDPARSAPDDVVGDGADLLGRAPGATVAQDVGLRFGPSDAEAVPTSAADYEWAGAGVAFEWSADEEVWVRQRGGQDALTADGEAVDADNVLFLSGADAGPLTLLRDGEAQPGTWSREPVAGAAAASPTAPARFLDAAGEDLLLAVGRTWVVLLPQDATPTLVDG